MVCLAPVIGLDLDVVKGCEGFVCFGTVTERVFAAQLFFFNSSLLRTLVCLASVIGLELDMVNGVEGVLFVLVQSRSAASPRSFFF